MSIVEPIHTDTAGRHNNNQTVKYLDLRGVYALFLDIEIWSINGDFFIGTCHSAVGGARTASTVASIRTSYVQTVTLAADRPPGKCWN